MQRPWLRFALGAALAAVLPAIACAQFPPPPPPPGARPAAPPPTVQDRWPEPAAPQRPAAVQEQPAQEAAPAKKPAAPRAAAPPANVVTCNGVFSKDSTHLNLAIKYDSRNVTYTEVDGPDGTRLNASVLYPNDAKRRLEVLWNNDASRSDTSVIVITGQSQWVGPKGLKLGIPLAALEKANGRPFKVSGFGSDGMAQVTDWQGGALTLLPGSCKMGVRLTPDRKAPEEARSALTGDRELISNDPNLRAARPVVGEIVVGY